MVLPEPLIDVLHIDDGVVHQRTDGDTHAAEGHRVDVHAEQMQHQHRA